MLSARVDSDIRRLLEGEVRDVAHGPEEKTMPHFNFALSTWTAPHWLTVAATAAAGAAVSYAESALVSGGLPATLKAVEAIAIGAVLAGVSAFIGVAKVTLTPTAQAVDNALAGKVPG
jgi:hypothetical protein